MAYTKLNIINTLLGAAKQTLRQTYQDLKPNKKNLAHLASSIAIARVIIKLTPLNVSSGNIALTRNGMQKNIKSFIKIEANQFAQLQTRLSYDFQKSSLIFTKYLQEQNSY